MLLPAAVLGAAGRALTEGGAQHQTVGGRRLGGQPALGCQSRRPKGTTEARRGGGPLAPAGANPPLGMEAKTEGGPMEVTNEPAGRIGALPIEDLNIAQRLALYNRRARMAFWSERRRGVSEEQALAAAARTLPR